MISWPDVSLPVMLTLALVIVTLAVIVPVRAVRERHKQRLLRHLRRHMVIAVQPDGRRVARPLVTHLWCWSAVSPDLLPVAVRAADPTLQGEGPVRALEAEIRARGAALTPAVAQFEASRCSHALLMGHFTQLSAGVSVSAFLPIMPSADEFCDVTCDSVDTGLLPGDFWDSAPLDVLGDVMPVLGAIDTVNRVRRRKQAGQTNWTALGVSAGEAVERGSGALGGGKAGALVGSLFGPVGTVVGAGLGALIGGKAGQGLAQYGRRGLLKNWEAELELELADVGDELAGTPAGRKRVERDLSSAQVQARTTLRTVRRAVRRRAWHPRQWIRPDPRLVLLQEVERWGVKATRQAETEVISLQRFVREAEPVQVAALLLHDLPRCERLGATSASVRRAQDLTHQIQTERSLLR